MREVILFKYRILIGLDEVQDTVSEEDIAEAQKELLEAKATYQVRQSVVETVMITNPVIKAVHSGSKASQSEQSVNSHRYVADLTRTRDLLPLIQQRDELSITLTRASKDVLMARNELQQVESQNMILARENAEMAERMLALAAEANTQKTEDIADPAVREKLQELEMDMKSSRQKWRIIKGTTSATIVGSGVDWARDPALVNIVLDSEE